MSTVSLTLSHRYSMTDDMETRLQLWVSEAVNMPPEVLLVRSVAAMAGVSASIEFLRTATYADMCNYTSAASDDAKTHRVRSLDILYPNRSDAVDDHDAILTAIQALVDEIVAVNAAEPDVDEEDF